MNRLETSASRQLFAKSQAAKKGGEDAWSCQSTGEKLAVALVLNRADWLERMDYTIGEALNRIGGDWVEAVPIVERVLRDQDDQ